MKKIFAFAGLLALVLALGFAHPVGAQMTPVITVASSTGLVSSAISTYWDFLYANLLYVIPFVIALAVLAWGLGKVTHRRVFPRRG